MRVRPVGRLVQELDAKSFTVVGSPCSDGLGTEAMQFFQAALAGAEGDFTVVLGDVSPLGRDPYYRSVAHFIDTVSPQPVHVMRGGRDGPDFSEYFGHENRAVIAEDFVLVMLDNSGRAFSDETLKFLQETMAIVDSRNVIVAFHMPPPNRISGDSLDVAEWNRFEEAVGVWRSRISLLLCGHAHTYYEDDIDGIRLVVTGGGGARIQRTERLTDAPHHALEIDMGENGTPVITLRPLAAAECSYRDDGIVDALDGLYGSQSRAHMRHILAAEDAERDGRPQLARLYRAAAKSNLRQARFIHHLTECNGDPIAAAATGLREFRADSEDARQDRVAAAEMARDVLAANAMRRLSGAGRVFAGLLEKALAELAGAPDLHHVNYYVCQSCGMIFSGEESPEYCSECGAPGYYLRESD